MDNDLKTTLMNDIYEAAIYKLAAAPKAFMAGAKAAKPPSMDAVGSVSNLSSVKPVMTQPTGKPGLANAIKRPMTTTGNLNEQLVLNTGLQSAGFKYPITSNSISSGGFGMMNTSQG